MDVESVGPIRDPETIARGRGIHALARLRRTYGRGHWRKRKGSATVRFGHDIQRSAEVHQYESGEDYLYPADYFLEVALPDAVEEALRRAS